MITEIAHFVRVAPAARRLQARMSFLDCYDLVEKDLDDAGKKQFRAALAGDLDGAVLEIGTGTGLMLPHYRTGARVVATDPDAAALVHAAARAKQSPARVRFVEARAESLPFPDSTFDAVVGASVLCSVQSMQQALSEARRVLKREGQLRLLEHVRSDRFIGGLLMDLFNPVWCALNGAGCNWNRNVEAAVSSAGFTVVEVKSFQLFSDTFPAAYPYRAIRAVRSSASAPDHKTPDF